MERKRGVKRTYERCKEKGDNKVRIDVQDVMAIIWR